MMWILHSKGVDSALHYLDDFLILGPPDCQSCQAALDSTLATCESLGFPVAPEKIEGPSTVLTFLGIELDTVRGQLYLFQNAMDVPGWPSGSTMVRQEARAALHTWPAPSCSYSGSSRQSIHVQLDRRIHNSHPPRPLGSPQRISQSRHMLVVYILMGMEWHQPPPPFHANRSHHLGCLGLMGLWGHTL